MRRAEKVAQKNRKEPVIKKARILVDLLSKTELPPQDDLLPVLAEVLPAVIEMVSLGDIALRNREEEQYFNSPDVLPDKITTMYERIQGTNADITGIRHNIGENIVIREKELLEKRYKFKKAELAGKERKVADLRQQLEECKAQVPDLISQLKKELAACTGRDVSLSPP
jgi:hypothetical protein